MSCLISSSESADNFKIIYGSNSKALLATRAVFSLTHKVKSLVLQIAEKKIFLRYILTSLKLISLIMFCSTRQQNSLVRLVLKVIVHELQNFSTKIPVQCAQGVGAAAGARSKIVVLSIFI